MSHFGSSEDKVLLRNKIFIVIFSCQLKGLRGRPKLDFPKNYKTKAMSQNFGG